MKTDASFAPVRDGIQPMRWRSSISDAFTQEVLTMNTEQLKPTLTLRLRLAFVGALFLFISTGVISQYSLNRSKNYAGAVAHSYEVLRHLQGLSSAVHLTQRDERGYLLSTDAGLITSFHEGWSRIAVHMRTLRELTQDNAVQQRR